jgi:hypothetical protein
MLNFAPDSSVHASCRLSSIEARDAIIHPCAVQNSQLQLKLMSILRALCVGAMLMYG